MNKNKLLSILTENRPLVLSSALLALVSLIIFNRIYSNCDIEAHSATCIAYINGEASLPGNFLYYLLTSLASFFNPHLVRISSTVLLAVFTVAKFIIVYQSLKSWGSDSFSNQLYLLVSLALVFISSVYIPQLFYQRTYLGSFTPNIWHNSTTIAVMPFALLLFLVTCNQVSNFTWRRFIIICILIALNAVIKPSYLFVYVFALPLASLLHHGLSRKLFAQSLPSLMALAAVWGLNFLIYNTESNNPSDASIAVKPFLVYSHWIHDPKSSITYLVFFASIITSFLFPIYVLINKGVNRKDIYSTFSIISIFGALIISILFIETGERTFNGNFFWQVYISSFIFFLVGVKNSFKELTFSSGLPIHKNINMVQVLFFMHLVFGLVHTFRLIVFQNWI